MEVSDHMSLCKVRRAKEDGTESKGTSLLATGHSPRQVNFVFKKEFI